MSEEILDMDAGYALMQDSKNQALRNSMFVASQTTPDEAVKSIKYSQEQGLPADISNSKPPASEIQKQVQDSVNYDDILKNNPKLSNYLSIHENASVSHDDIPNATQHETLVDDHVNSNNFSETMNSALTSVMDLITKTPQGFLNIAQLPASMLSDLNSITGGMLPLYRMHPNTKVEDLLSGEAKDAWERIQSVQESDSQEVKRNIYASNWMSRLLKGDIAGGGIGMAHWTVEQVPIVAAMILAPLTSASVMGFGTQSEVQQKSIDAGVNPTLAITNGIVQAAAITFLRSEKALPAITAIRESLLKSVGTEGAKATTRSMLSEMGRSVGITALDYAAGGTAMRISEYISGTDLHALDNPDEWLMQSLAEGAILGGGTNLIHRGPEMARRVSDAKRTKDFYIALGETSEASKIRQRLPDSHKNLVSEITKNGPVENIYITTEAFEETLKQKGQDPVDVATKLGIAEAYDNAKATTSPIIVPLADWVKNVVGQDIYKEIANDVKFGIGENDYTVNEAKAHNEEVQARFDEQNKIASEQASSEHSLTEQQTRLTAEIQASGETASASKTLGEHLTDAFRGLGLLAKVQPAKIAEGLSVKSAEAPAIKDEVLVSNEPIESEALKQAKKGRSEDEPSISPETKALFEKFVEDYGVDLSEKQKPEGFEKTIADWKKELERVEKEDKAMPREKRDIIIERMEPVYARAEKAKPWYDAKINKIADILGIEARITGIKGIGRVAEKLWHEYTTAELKQAKRIAHVGNIKDLVRSTLVVNNLEELPATLREVNKYFKITRFKDRFIEPLKTGYSDILLNVDLGSGLEGEIQISVPEMIAGKHIGHHVYDKYRALESDPIKNAKELARLEDLQKKIYGESSSAAFSKISLSKSDLLKGMPSAQALAYEYSSERVVSNDLAVRLEKRTTGKPSTSIISEPSGSASNSALIASDIIIPPKPSIAELNGEREVLKQAFKDIFHDPNTIDRPPLDVHNITRASILFEVAPDPNNTVATAAWNRLPKDVQVRISKHVVDFGLPSALRDLHLKGGTFVQQVGGYQGGTNTSLALKLRPEMSSADAISAAKYIGYVLRQDSMMVTSSVAGEGLNKADVVTFDTLSAADPKAINDKLWAVEIKGYKPFQGFSSDPFGSKMSFTLDGETLKKLGITSEEVSEAGDRALENKYNYRLENAYVAFIGKGEYEHANDFGRQGETTPQGTSLGKSADNLRSNIDKGIENRIADFEARRHLNPDESSQADVETLSQAEKSKVPPLDAVTDRGQISLSGMRGLIQTFKNKDLSTILHESSHYFFKVIETLALKEGSTPEIKQIHKDTLNWLGIDNVSQLTEAHKEKWAESYETYVMEGKAPSEKMRRSFFKFKTWLTGIYGNIKNRTPLDPQIRDIFDRMLTGQTAEARAEQRQGLEPMFKDAKSAGMTEVQFSEYSRAVAEARQYTEEAVTKQALAKHEKKQKAIYAKKRALVEPDVRNEVEAMPVYSAIDKMVNDKNDMNPIKIDRSSVPPELLAKMPKGTIASKDGFSADMVAEILGYEGDGLALVKDITSAVPKENLIEDTVYRRMLKLYPDVAEGFPLDKVALEAIHNDKQAEKLVMELKHIAQNNTPVLQAGIRKIAKRPTSVAEAKAKAHDIISAKEIRNINSDVYLRNEREQAKKAGVEFAKGNMDGAFEAKNAELINHELYSKAVAAKKYVDKQVDYLKKFDKPEFREKIDLEYRDQIDAILHRYDIRRSVSNKALAKKESLATFVEAMASKGLDPNISEKLLNELEMIHYKEMPLEEFEGLVDSVRSIAKLGQLKNKLIVLGEARQLEELVNEAVVSTSKLPQRDKETNRGLNRMEKAFLTVKASGRSLQASLLKMEQMFDWLDNGDSNGVFNRVVFRRIAEAGVHEADMQKQIKANLGELSKSLMADITKDSKKIYEAKNLIDGLTGKPQKFTTKEFLSLLGNMGNESNLEKLSKGEGWDKDEVWSFVHQNATKAQWDFVAGLGKTLEGMWPEKLAMSRRLGNTNPPKVQPRAFQTPHGEYAGWYWPMVYDPSRSADVADRGARKSDQLFENTYSRADTSTGRMTTRLEKYARPLLLSLDTIPSVIGEEIHDLAYREAIIDADKFLSHPEVRASVESALSPEHYEQIKPWLQSIANDRKVDMKALKWFDKLAHGARTRATMVGLGYRLSTIMIHGASAGVESIAEVGPTWFAKGLADFSNPTKWQANKDFVFSRSGEMRNRMNEVDRDIREHLREIEHVLMDPTSSALVKGNAMLKAHAYQGIAMIDMASALPTWMGAYHKAMDPKGLNMSEADAIYFADKTVRNAHGGSGAKDLSAIQRGPEFFKLTTMFYSFWNHNVNRLMDTGRKATTADTWKDSGKASTTIMRMLIYTLGVQTLHHMVSPPKKDDEESWFKWAAKELGTAATAGIPVIRDIASHYLNGKDYSVTPAAQMVEQVGRTGKDAMAVMMGKSVSDKWLKNMIATAGYVFGSPLGQASSTSQFIWDVGSGKQNPHSASDWWRGIVTGNMHKK